MREIFPTLTDMKKQAQCAKTAPPYVYEFYNVMGYSATTSSANHTAIGRILNSYIEALNSRERLPRFLIVIIDKDIIDDVNVFEFGATKEIAENVHWLVRQITMFTRRRKAEIAEMKPGAVYETDPKIILVNMIKQVHSFSRSSHMESIVSLRSKFNNVLNNAAINAGCSILNIDACDSGNHFDLMGKLNHFGQFVYWKQMNHILENFDKTKIRLDPKREVCNFQPRAVTSSPQAARSKFHRNHCK